jgi:hypothetical protein
MGLAPPVYNIEVKLLQSLKPSCKLSFWFLKVAEPGQGAMIRAEEELPARQVGAILLCETDNGQ